MNEKRYCARCGGHLEERMAEGRPRKVCTSCGAVAYENPIPATAVVCFRGETVLLVRRSQPPRVGDWCLPGGFLEMDELPAQGALRELREETGLKGGDDPTLLGLEISPNALYGEVLLAGYEARIAADETPVAGDDSSEAAFFSVTDHPELAFASHQRILDRALALRARPRPTLPVGAYVITTGDHVALARRACLSGARVIQYRNKKASRRERLEEAGQIRALTREHGVLLVVNDDPDLAVMVGADGVHLGQEDWPVEAVRRYIPAGMMLGLSTHSLEQAREARAKGADYIGIGPVYATPTKPDYSCIGWDTVRAVLSEVSLPAVVIGGLDEKDLEQLAAHKARHAAMVRAVDQDAERLIGRLNQILDRVQAPS